MPQWHQIFCKSDSGLTRAQIAETAGDVWYGEGDLRFTPEKGDPAIGDVEWDELSIYVPTSGRPIIFYWNAGTDEVVRNSREELIDELDGLPKAIEDDLAAAVQVIALELAPDLLDDDSWEMLDLVQAFIMRQLDGILVTPDGIYDEHLQFLLEIEEVRSAIKPAGSGGSAGGR